MSKTDFFYRVPSWNLEVIIPYLDFPALTLLTIPAKLNKKN